MQHPNVFISPGLPFSVTVPCTGIPCLSKRERRYTRCKSRGRCFGEPGQTFALPRHGIVPDCLALRKKKPSAADRASALKDRKAWSSAPKALFEDAEEAADLASTSKDRLASPTMLEKLKDKSTT